MHKAIRAENTGGGGRSTQATERRMFSSASLSTSSSHTVSQLVIGAADYTLRVTTTPGEALKGTVRPQEAREVLENATRIQEIADALKSRDSELARPLQQWIGESKISIIGFKANDPYGPPSSASSPIKRAKTEIGKFYAIGIASAEVTRALRSESRAASRQARDADPNDF